MLLYLMCGYAYETALMHESACFLTFLCTSSTAAARVPKVRLASWSVCVLR